MQTSAFSKVCESAQMQMAAQDCSRHFLTSAAASAGTPDIAAQGPLAYLEPHGLYTVIKPIYGAASIGVVRVNDVQQLEAAYKRVTRELAKAHIVAGALQQGEEDEDEAADEAIEATVSQVNVTAA